MLYEYKIQGIHMKRIVLFAIIIYLALNIMSMSLPFVNEVSNYIDENVSGELEFVKKEKFVIKGWRLRFES